MKKGHVRFRGGIVLLISTFAIFIINPVFAGYVTVPVSASSGSVEVWDTANGIEYGKARIDYWYWQEPDELWHYSYQLINSEIIEVGGKKETEPPDAYHFGWLYLPPVIKDPSAYNPISKFSIDFDPDLDGQGPPDLEAYDAGSTEGGNPWVHAIHDYTTGGNTGIDWTITGAPSAMGIDPVRWLYDKGWVYYDGYNSTDDSSLGYFHLVSEWGPELRWAGLAVEDLGIEGGGWVMAPGVVPEPATYLILALGGLTLISKRRRTGLTNR